MKAGMAGMGALAVVLAVLLVGLVVLMVQAAFLKLGARMAGIEKRSFGRMLLTALLGSLAGAILGAVLSPIPVAGAALGFAGGFVGMALVLMTVSDTGFGKALGATVIGWLLGILVFGAIAVLLVLAFGWSLAPA